MSKDSETMTELMNAVILTGFGGARKAGLYPSA